MKKGIIMTSIIIFSLILVGVGCNNSSQSTQKTTQQSDLELQAKCADYAKQYFNSKGYKNNDGFDYKNHFNSRLNKCFIFISSYDANSDFASMDLYDALEGTHYATYNGHSICDPTVLSASGANPKKCLVDSGSIWFDGNDTKNPADFTVGFRGLQNGGGSGDENTQKIFMEHVQAFMDN